MPQLNDEQYWAVAKFADSLIECFEHTQKTSTDERSQRILDHVMNIISIHKNLAELDFRQYVNERENNILTK